MVITQQAVPPRPVRENHRSLEINDDGLSTGYTIRVRGASDWAGTPWYRPDI